MILGKKSHAIFSAANTGLQWFLTISECINFPATRPALKPLTHLCEAVVFQVGLHLHFCDFMHFPGAAHYFYFLSH